MADDYYKTLGVSRNASQAEIQKAYRDLARKYHPDLHPDDKSAKKKFQELQQAFDVLNDPSKRELYDRYGSSFEQMGGGQPHPGRSWTGEAGGAEDFDFSQVFGERFGPNAAGGFADIFEQVRRGGGNSARGGRGRRAARPPEPQDLHHELEVPFLSAVNGGEVALHIDRGDGKHEELLVKIPPGIETGQTIRLRGQGAPSPSGGTPGDLKLKITVTGHPYFTRQGANLLVKLPVSVGEAALGAKVDVPSPRGTVSVQIPPGTSSGKKLRVRGHGVVSRTGPAGDLLAEVQIVLPAHLDDASRELIQRFEQQNPLQPRRHLS